MGLIFTDIVDLDDEEQSTGQSNERTVGFEPDDRDIPAHVQQIETKDADAEEIRGKARSQFAVYFPSRPTINVGGRIKWRDSTDRVWTIVVDSLRDEAGRGKVWKAMGWATDPLVRTP